MTRSKILNFVLAAAFLFGTAAGLGACNTIEGVGKDVSATARTVKKALD